MKILRAKISRPGGLKKILPRSLFARSLLILVTPIILIQLITSYVFFDRHWSKVTTRLAYAVAGEVATLADEIEFVTGSPAEQKRIFESAERNLSLFLEYRAGQTLDKAQHKKLSKEALDVNWESAVAQRLSAEMKAITSRPFTLDVDFSNGAVEMHVQLEKGVLYVSFPQRRLYSSSSYIFLLWMFGASLVLLVVAVLFMRNQIRPIRRLAVAAERLGKGRDVPLFRPQGAREVRMAAQAFLDMHKRIRRQIEQRTTMLAGVSHDLRTPLTRLRLQLEMLGDSPDIDAMKSDVAEMEKMIGGYLDFVRDEGEEAVSYINFNSLVEKVITAAKRQGLEIVYDIEGDININIRPMAFERCLMNLLSNAAKYADHVWFSAKAEGGLLDVCVEDNGPGIPEEQYEEVFKPFYRVDSSRNSQTGGVGLGLPIAMDVVHSHGGKIWLEKSAHGGLSVRIRLPL